MAKYPIEKITIAGTPVEQYQIVAGQTDLEQEAASLLSVYLEKACGVKLSVVNSGAPEAAYEIVVGETDRQNAHVQETRETLRNDGILFYVENNVLYLTGENDLAVRYAVSKFLEQQLGCRFFDEENEVIKPADVIDIPAELDYSYSPRFFYRQVDWGTSTELRRHWGANSGEKPAYTFIGFCHTMGRLSETSDNAQPCLTDEKTYQTVLKNVNKWIDENPGCRIISVTQNDNCEYCKCPRCRALAEKENQSGVMVTFVNRLAEEIEKKHPEVSLLTFAYQYTRKPPVTVKPRNNVIIWLCSIECSFSTPLYERSSELNREFDGDFKGWAEKGAKIQLWDYVTNFKHLMAPFPNTYVLQQNAKYFADNNTVGVYEEGGYQQRENGEFRSLKAYLIGQLLWNPDMTPERYKELMVEFLQYYYGAAWKTVLEYIDRTAEEAAKENLSIFYDWRIFRDEQGRIRKDFIYEMEALWDKAQFEADSQKAMAHVTASRCQVDFLVAMAKAFGDGIYHQDNPTPDYEANKKLVMELKLAGVQRHTEWGDYGSNVADLDEQTCRVTTPNAWDVLQEEQWRKRWNLPLKRK